MGTYAHHPSPWSWRLWYVVLFLSLAFCRTVLCDESFQTKTVLSKHMVTFFRWLTQGIGGWRIDFLFFSLVLTSSRASSNHHVTENGVTQSDSHVEPASITYQSIQCQYKGCRLVLCPVPQRWYRQCTKETMLLLLFDIDLVIFGPAVTRQVRRRVWSSWDEDQHL